MQESVKNIVILGGGTAGWVSASLLAKVLGKVVNIKLIESDQIGIVGVGEATIPPICNFNAALGIDERDFLNKTNGSIKLGIQFENWGEIGDSYMHAFGGVGKDFPFCTFHNFWLRAKAQGDTSDFWDYSLNYQASKQNKFSKLAKIEGTNLPGLAYAYHFDASLYAQLLREYSENLGVQRIEGKVADVEQVVENGFIEKLILEDGTEVAGDLFLDCSGLHELLIEKTLNTGFEDWSHWLPCDRAVAVQCDSVPEVTPYTRSIAHPIGWQWRIPLQNRTGNGLVYSSKYCSDDEAKQTLLDNLDAPPTTEPRVIKFKTGRRRKQWNKNVVSIGLSSGFLEPLESTSIHLIQSAVTRLIKCFPHQGINPHDINEFNRQSKDEIERIRDFIILHYKQTNRTDSRFWRDCKDMDVPSTLLDKIELFKQTGKVFRQQDDLFTEIAWTQVLIGQGVIPRDIHPLSDSLSDQQLSELMDNLKAIVSGSVNKLSSHNAFLSALK